jgi:hypothetical protein
MAAVHRGRVGAAEPLPAEMQLDVGADDNVLLMPGGRVRSQVLSGGRVLFTDERNPRATRSQMYDPARPGQPYLPPHVEDLGMTGP